MLEFNWYLCGAEAAVLNQSGFQVRRRTRKRDREADELEDRGAR